MRGSPLRPVPAAPSSFGAPWLVAPGELPQLGLRPVEEILVTRQAAAVVVLPEGPERPAGRQGPGGPGLVTGYPQRVVRGEGAASAGARVPPVGGRVDHGVAPGEPLHLVAERLDPADHARLAHAVAPVLGAVRVVFDVERGRQCPAVRVPPAAVV